MMCVYRSDVEASRQLAQPRQKWRHVDDIGRNADLHQNRPYQSKPRRRLRATAACGCVGTAVRGGVGG